jgi:stalled ribosome rescue protein Dom34
MKAAHIMKEIQSLAKMDAILVLVLLDRFLVQKWHVDQIILANMKVLHTMKEIQSLAKMDAILVLALLDK